MLDLMFYSMGRKPKGKNIAKEWAEIYFQNYLVHNDNEKKIKFKNARDSIEDAEIFESSDIEQDFFEKLNVEESVEKIVKEKHPEVILISTLSEFMEVVRFSKNEEMIPEMIMTRDRTMLYYAMVGEGKCALLVAANYEYSRND